MDGSRTGGEPGGLSGGGFPLPMGKAGGGGIGLIILLVIYLLVGGLPGGGGGLGVDPGTGALPQAPAADGGRAEEGAGGRSRQVRRLRRRRRRRDLEEDLRGQSGKTYEQPIIVLYDNGG